ncbi:MAG TPA: efflux RND transporter permease subunit [Bacteroidia bacterium]|jgi:multidrug efflux pump|nr:efflux RND transporter permease subunit [Bacteroidia bacterium]
MNISSTSINRPVLAIVMSLIILLFGVIGYKFLGVREFPAIDPPVITVRTSYTGASAEVIESQITEPLEKVINGIDGIRTISSTSAQGVSSITVEFNLNANLESAANDVRDKVSQAVRQLPQDIDGLPTVTKADANSDAIVSMTIQSDSRSMLEVDDYVENVLVERLQTIPGVSSIQIWGQKKYSMRLWMDPDKLSSLGLTPLDVQQALVKENLESPSGKVTGKNNELIVQTKGRMSTVSDFENLVLKTNGTQLVKFKNVGRVELGPENLETNLKIGGTNMIGMGLVPQPGANYIDIADEFYRRMEKIKKEIPKDYKIDIALDNTKFVRKALSEVSETLMIAIVLVILIIYLFFRDWLIAFRPLIDLPVSLIGAFFIMYIMGFSVNVLTLLAIVLATGLVVDDGIVVTENIYKKIEDGMDPVEAAHKGSKEIFFAVVSTSITLVAVFLPVIFLQGFVGQLFREFGVVIAGAVLISAFVSLTLTPMLNARMVRKGGHRKSKFYIMTEPFFERLEKGYSDSLGKFLKRRWIAWPVLVVSTITGVILWFALPSELAPLDDRSWLRVNTTAPEGTSFEYMDNFMDKLAKTLADSIKEQRMVLSVTSPGFIGAGSVNSGSIRLMLKEDGRKKTQQQWADYANKITRGFPEGKVFISQEQTISASGGPRGGLPVQFVIQASTFEKLKSILPKFLEAVGKSQVFQGTDCNLKFNKPELDITILRDKAKSLGVSVQDIAQTLQLAFSGNRFSYFVMNDKQYQVIGQLELPHRDKPTDVTSLYVRSSNGNLIQLDNLVKMEQRSNPPQLYHYNRYQAATISAGLAPGKTIGDGLKEMNRIAKSCLDETFSTATTGPSRDYEESGSNILFAFVLALILIYLILAAQFESFIDPFIIMSTILLAFAGAMISLWYFNQTLNIFSQIGIIMLIGLVTKNGILIVEFANQLKERGVPFRDAIQQGATARLRPILMTSIATSLGALPIAMSLGAAAKSRMSMGIVVVGGILFSLSLTLYVIPAIYSFLSKKHKAKA